MFNGDLAAKRNKILSAADKNRRRYLTLGIVSVFLFLTVVYLGPLGGLEHFGLVGQKKQGQGSSASGVEAAPDEILLKFKPGANKGKQDKTLKEHGLTVKEEMPQIGVKLVKVPEQARDKVVEALSHNPAVDFAELNAIVKPDLVPNDPNYSKAWHLPKIQTPAAWDKTKAAGVLIAICDTGINQVEDLFPILRTDLGWNVVDSTNNWSDSVGHGTQVAGAAAAATNNGIGVAGVAWDARIIPVRISNVSTGSASVSNAAKCIEYAADHGARIINVSYLMGGSATINTAGTYAQSKGAVTTVAAGNDGVDPGWPNLPGFLAVSATDQLDRITSWSNFGVFVDVSAPGNNIMSTRYDGTYWTATGTSIASPVAAGVLGLIFGAKPTLTALQAQSILLNNTDDLGDPGYDIKFGWGRVNADKAVTAALGTVPADTTAPTSSISSPSSGSTVSGGVSVNVSASDNIGVAKVDLYVDGALFATDTTSAYSFFWDTTAASNANHSLVAKAYDSAGNIGTSSTVTVAVNNVLPTPTPSPSIVPTPVPTPSPASSDTTQPTVSLTTPANGATLTRNSTANITADASDNIGVVKVEFLVNGAVTCTDTTASYSCSWKVPGKPNASYTLTAKAYDSAGNSSSAVVSVNSSN